MSTIAQNIRPLKPVCVNNKQARKKSEEQTQTNKMHRTISDEETTQGVQYGQLLTLIYALNYFMCSVYKEPNIKFL